MSTEASTRSEFESLTQLGTAGLDTAFIRVGMAGVLWVHALARFGIDPRASGATVGDFGGFLGMLGVPAPGLMAWVVTLVEVLGGLFLLLGVLVRLSAAAIAIDMFVALSMVHWPGGWAEEGWAIELTGLLVLLALAIVIRGPGNLSLDRMLFGTDTSTEDWILQKLGLRVED